MSERDDSYGLRMAVRFMVVGLLILIAIAYAVNLNQANSIRDLQRRVDQLEVRSQRVV